MKPIIGVAIGAALFVLISSIMIVTDEKQLHNTHPPILDTTADGAYVITSKGSFKGAGNYYEIKGPDGKMYLFVQNFYAGGLTQISEGSKK